MEEPFSVKFSAFPIYRFFRNELPAMTKAALVCIVLCGVLAFVVFSPGFSFATTKEPASAVASVEIGESYAQSGIFQDSEPLFLPTHWNFGADVSPKELTFQDSSFLPFGEMLFLGTQPSEPAMKLKHAQIPPAVENALGADAWSIARGFGAGTLDVPAVSETPVSRIRIEDASTGKIVFGGELPEIHGEDDGMLVAPAEFLCGIASDLGAPRVMTVRSSGSSEHDAEMGNAAESLLSKLGCPRGIYRIFIDPR